MARLSYGPLAAGIALAVATASAAEPVRLAPPQALAPGVEALPQIAQPQTPATNEINARLKQTDEAWLKGRAECLARGPESAVKRTVEAPMLGPDLFAVVVRHVVYCQGRPHANQFAEVTTFDLATGALVNWSQLAPGVSQRGSNANPVVSWPALKVIYLRKARATLGDDRWSACEVPLTDDRDQFRVWPDAKGGGLRAAPSWLQRGAEDCGPEVLLGPSDLRALKLSRKAAGAIASAHRGGAYR